MKAEEFWEGKELIKKYEKWLVEYLRKVRSDYATFMTDKQRRRFEVEGNSVNHRWRESRDGKFFLLTPLMTRTIEELLDPEEFADEMEMSGLFSVETGAHEYLLDSRNGMTDLEGGDKWYLENEDEYDDIYDDVCNKSVTDGGIYLPEQIGFSALKEKLSGVKVRSVFHHGYFYNGWYLVVVEDNVITTQQGEGTMEVNAVGLIEGYVGSIFVYFFRHQTRGLNVFVNQLHSGIKWTIKKNDGKSVIVIFPNFADIPGFLSNWLNPRDFLRDFYQPGGFIAQGNLDDFSPFGGEIMGSGLAGLKELVKGKKIRNAVVDPNKGYCLILVTGELSTKEAPIMISKPTATWQQVDAQSLKENDRVRLTGKIFQRALGRVIYLDDDVAQIEFDDDFKVGHDGSNLWDKPNYPKDKKIQGLKTRWNFKRDDSEGFAFECEE